MIMEKTQSIPNVCEFYELAIFKKYGLNNPKVWPDFADYFYGQQTIRENTDQKMHLQKIANNPRALSKGGCMIP